MTDITLQNFRDWVAAQPENTAARPIFRPGTRCACPLVKYLEFINPNFYYTIDYGADYQTDNLIIKVRCKSGNSSETFRLEIDPIFADVVKQIDKSPDIIRIGQASDWTRVLPKDALLRIIDFHIEEAA